MERSRKLVLTNWTQANDALNQFFAGNKSALTKHLKMSRTTVTAFFKPEPVREAEFRKICFALRLNWQEVSAVKAIAPQSQAGEANHAIASPEDNHIDALIPQVREHCRQKILNQHSRMRLLSGEEIGVDQLYVDVWVLNRSPRTYQVSQSKLLETFDLRNDRLGLGDRIQRNEGFEVAKANPKLVILGKPGSGKTTFLKHLAVDWCKGEFQKDLIAVLIEFRQIRDEQWHLLDVIGKELELDEGYQIRALKDQIRQIRRSYAHNDLSHEDIQQKDKQIERLQERLNKLPLQTFLTQGKFLILMDGLDEVPKNDLRHNVQDQLRVIAEEYPKNRFALTCRTQIMNFIPDGFTSVEVADFSSDQVQQFVKNWFVSNSKSEVAATQQWETIRDAVDSSSSLRELTVTPVLLSLICLILRDEGEIPSERTLLYRKGIKLLLSRWNEEKQIDGWDVGSKVYGRLSIEQREKLLIEIAAHQFEDPKNFVLFEQDEIADQVTQLLHLVSCKEGVDVLKTIEAQHGLLIERADELWSFSHLTFQEYFTVQWLTQLPPEQLAYKIVKQQWQEVVKQLVKSQQPADRLLRLIKYAIDQSVVRELEINHFLTWILQKSERTQVAYEITAIRAFYFALALSYIRACDLTYEIARSLARDRARNLARDLDLDLDLAFNLDRRGLARDCLRNLALNFDPTLDRGLDLDLNLDRDLILTLDLALDFDLDRGLDLDLALKRALNRSLTYARKFMPKLAIQLDQIRVSLPQNSGEFCQWWQTFGEQWVEQLRQAMVEHRNIGHDWQFTDAQRQQLKRYYDANKFLVDLMNIEGAVSDSVRAEIEDTLLLPWDELQRRQPDVYGESQSTSSSPVKVFISYSQEDEDLREVLDRHLANLKRQGKIQAWHKGAVEAGTEWDAAIKQQLETAHIILLLISADFIASDHCYNLQLQQALQRHHAGTARVIPIILRSTDWQGSPFSNLSALPTDGIPITSWNNRDEAFLNVVEGIRGAIESFVR